ncbi:SusC/RagA family TonB-linked outer membrane protein [Rufibacter sediminis]|uniref:TonB-dependent receptor n=1 Tax=Rufibacter sediminis TaxID=2762756 RepID=A0ABR6VWG4_9BACT|nr:TonB-dependent receptor [Rufibacter sediminis]MBC3541178.1 TonB-dependent receptor [Rufibacter sediminis]
MQQALLKKSRYLWVLTFFFTSVVSAFAQAVTVTGKVTDEKKEGLPGVTVLLKGTTTANATDMNGNYSLSVPSGTGTLVFTYIGFQPQEVPINGRTSINVTLASDQKALDEVVVIGYQTVNRRDLTGSVSSVGSKQLADIPINSAAEAITGRLAGVQITTTEGSPNAEATIRVRGGGSITQDNSPLYIVDGIQVENALSVLSPQDIESVDVLKDASSTAIYGSRGANGVVIITTKGGREMKTTVNYSGLVGVRQLANKLDVMNPYDFVRYQYERSRNGQADRDGFLETYGTYADIELYKDVPFVDWQEEVFGRDALMQTHNLSVTGGTAATKFNLSLTSNTEEGIMLGSDFDRKLVNFRFDHNLSEKVSVGFNVRYNHTEVNGAGTAVAGSSSLNRLRHSVKYRPFLSGGQGLTDYDQDYAEETNANSLALVNPILLTDAEYRHSNGDVLNLNGYVNLKLNKFFTFKSTLGVDLGDTRVDVFNDSITAVSRLNGSSLPIASIQHRVRNTLNNSNVLTFSNAKADTKFSKDHAITVLLGQEIYEETFKENFQESRLFPSGISPELALGSMSLGTPQIPTSNEETAKLLSFFSRVQYSFKDKYFFNATMRADGSSKFAEGNKWGYFPSAQLAWRLSNEEFIQNSLPEAITDLKLRLSYGEAGNNRIMNFGYRPLFDTGAPYGLLDQQVTGYYPRSLANPALKWETTISRNLGFDAAFLNNRLQLTIDAYSNKTQDLLVNVPVPSETGFRTQFQNVGSTRNRGVELQITGTPIEKTNFNWTSSFNISFNKNEVVKYGRQDFDLFASGWAGGNAPSDYAVQVGRPVGTIWGLVTDGYYKVEDFDYNATAGTYTLKKEVPSNQSIIATAPQPGVLKFRDINNDGVVNDNDRTFIGDANPDFFGGFNNQIAYKNFDLSVFVNFQVGNDVLNANKLEFSSGYSIHSNLLTIMNDRWRNVNSEGVVVTAPEELAALNANATLWSPLTSASSFYVHSWAVEDASFLRINNITLGYTLPANLLTRAKIQKLRVYGTVNNLAVFTNYSGYDPEVSTRRGSPITSGVDYAAYPRSRAFILGVNLTL